jgi:hypothetical protein
VSRRLIAGAEEEGRADPFARRRITAGEVCNAWKVWGEGAGINGHYILRAMTQYSVYMTLAVRISLFRRLGEKLTSSCIDRSSSPSLPPSSSKPTHPLPSIPVFPRSRPSSEATSSRVSSRRWSFSSSRLDCRSPSHQDYRSAKSVKAEVYELLSLMPLLSRKDLSCTSPAASATSCFAHSQSCGETKVAFLLAGEEEHKLTRLSLQPANAKYCRLPLPLESRSHSALPSEECSSRSVRSQLPRLPHNADLRDLQRRFRPSSPARLSGSRSSAPSSPPSRYSTSTPSTRASSSSSRSRARRSGGGSS